MSSRLLLITADQLSKTIHEGVFGLEIQVGHPIERRRVKVRLHPLDAENVVATASEKQRLEMLSHGTFDGAPIRKTEMVEIGDVRFDYAPVVETRN